MSNKDFQRQVVDNKLVVGILDDDSEVKVIGPDQD